MDTSYIDAIRQNRIIKWSNGKYGRIALFNREQGQETTRTYRFVEINPETNQYVYGITEQSSQTQVVAVGIVAFWLSSPKNTDIKIIFKEYSRLCLLVYTHQYQSEVTSWHKNLEKRFYWSVHLQEEQKNIAASKSLNLYINKTDRRQLKKMVRGYKNYVRRKWFEMCIKPILTPLWRVLETLYSIFTQTN